MARHKDGNWNIPLAAATWEQAGVAVLMDIRDELKRINATLACPDFQAIPARLKRISRNTFVAKHGKEGQ